jgi:sugar phosphate isomerase/epimerase
MTRPFSLSFLTYHGATPPQAIRIAAEAGYDFVGLRLLPAAPGGIAFRLMDDPAALAETQAALHETGMRVFDVEMIRVAADFSVEPYRPFLETCASLGARGVLVAGDDTEEARLADNFALLCDAMKPFGISAELEFMPQSKVADAAAACRLLRRADRPNAGIIVDSLHVSRSRTTVEALQDIPREWLHYAQICDGPAAIPTSLDDLNFAARHARLLPGDGAIDLKGIFSALPTDLPVAVEVPNDEQSAGVSAVEWARCGLVQAKAVLAGVDRG